MFEKKRSREWFGKDIGRHVRSGYPVGAKSAVGNVVADKVMTNVDVFRTGSDGRIISKCASALVVRKKGKRSRNRKRI